MTTRALRPGSRVGRPFERGNVGKKPGARDRRKVLGQQAALALESQAWDAVEGLFRSSSWRAREAAAKIVLSYGLGLPKQTLELAGGVGTLAAELTKALAEARVRRAALEADRGVASLLALPLPILAPPGAEISAPEAPVLGEVEPEPAAGEETP